MNRKLKYYHANKERLNAEKREKRLATKGMSSHVVDEVKRLDNVQTGDLGGLEFFKRL